MNPNKLRLARLLDRLGLNTALRRLRERLCHPSLRAVNYHDVPARLAEPFEEQLRFFARHFVPVGPRELGELLADRWPHRKPGLLITFDDGLRSHAEVAAPLLERHGFPGWFFVPAAFPEIPVEHQVGWAREHQIVPLDVPPDGRLALTWEEARRLRRHHVVGCHTSTHPRLATGLSPQELEREIVQAKERLEDALGGEVDSFAWVGGEEWAYSASAAAAIREAGFRWSFLTNHALLRPGDDPLRIERSHVEASFPPALARFQISGFLDLLYWPKRRRVRRLLAPGD